LGKGFRADTVFTLSSLTPAAADLTARELARGNFSAGSARIYFCGAKVKKVLEKIYFLEKNIIFLQSWGIFLVIVIATKYILAITNKKKVPCS
jgi:hypothetical protein